MEIEKKNDVHQWTGIQEILHLSYMNCLFNPMTKSFMCHIFEKCLPKKEVTKKECFANYTISFKHI